MRLLSSAGRLQTEETPSGTIDGVNATFTLSVAPLAAGNLMLFKNGLLQVRGGSADYQLSGNTITFNAGAIPATGDVLLAFFR